jgi:hypothetical protein
MFAQDGREYIVPGSCAIARALMTGQEHGSMTEEGQGRFYCTLLLSVFSDEKIRFSNFAALS